MNLLLGHAVPNPVESILRRGSYLALLLSAASWAQTYKYDFGSGKVQAGYTQVTAATMYSAGRGYGFETGSKLACDDRGGADALRSDFCTSTDDFFRFSVKVPQGNYNLTVHFGDPGGSSETTVQTENHRFLFDRVATSNGQTLSKTITVNRREPRSTDGSVTMSINDRERTYYTWDDKLTIWFYGTRKAVAGIELTPVNDAVTVFLCGNSTVVDQLDAGNDGWCSWGQVIGRFFKPGVAIANYAESGLTSGSFLAQKRLTKILAEAKPGDYVFVEFGHNDQKTAQGVSSYPGNLKTFRDQILAKKAIPIFVTPTARNGDTDPKTSIGGLAETMRKTAKSLGVPHIDLNAMVIQVIKALGAQRGTMYKDVSHFTYYGGYEVARSVAKGITELDNSLTPFLLNDLPVFDPTKPDPVNVLTTPGVPTVSISRAARFTGGYSIAVRGDRIEYATPADQATEIVLLSLDGRVVRRQALPPAQTSGVARWDDPGSLRSGVYMAILKNSGTTVAQATYSRM